MQVQLTQFVQLTQLASLHCHIFSHARACVRQSVLYPLPWPLLPLSFQAPTTLYKDQSSNAAIVSHCPNSGNFFYHLFDCYIEWRSPLLPFRGTGPLLQRQCRAAPNRAPPPGRPGSRLHQAPGSSRHQTPSCNHHQIIADQPHWELIRSSTSTGDYQIKTNRLQDANNQSKHTF